MLKNQITEPPDQPASFGGAQPRPGPALKRSAGRLDGTVDIPLIALRRLGNHLASGGILDGKGLARSGVDPLSIDQELAPLLDEAFNLFIESNFCCCDAHN